MILNARVISICLVVFSVSGCYTQVRSPLEREKALSRSESDMQGSMPSVAMQRFEYYQDYGRTHIHDPYDFGRAYPYRYYDSFDDNMYWLYRSRSPRWYTSQIAWNQACWVSVYHPTWRRYPPAILLPHIVYRSPILGGHQVPEVAVRKRPRPNPRQTFTEGQPSSAGAIRTNSVNTRPKTQTRPQPSSGTSSKQTTTEKKKEEKEEKREKKREKGKKRGGMR
ncbi:MAG: hypothetical protein HOE48_04460 [Candidatus Latescibacteria bacterium]|jgi:hypothetical protein|nr:hypothetical protein [Candidatus Latescibacterota bacterium]